MKNPLPFITFPAFVACFLALCSGAPKPFFEQKWNQDFRLRAIESGDTLAVGAAFCDGSRVFVYDRAAGTIVILNATGTTAAVRALEGIGRDSYFGDDFIAKDTVFIFVNPVDRRLEYFSRASGKHLHSHPLPLEALKSQKKRSRTIINRIEIVNDTVLVGNAHVLVDLGSGLAKSAVPKTIRAAPSSGRFALVHASGTYVQRADTILALTSRKKAALPASHFTIPGKRLFVLNGMVYAVVAGSKGISIQPALKP
ncbi:MAG: hypothetical protein JXA71_18455 [Chitinispirillaceae bacterium]|nr:hypothetical protein [Chitinispirillaceae bacterium]